MNGLRATAEPVLDEIAEVLSQVPHPAMGWLFAVALGLHRGSRKIVLLSLAPLALGHAAAVGLGV
jgi:hypothetical protein